MLRSLFLLPLVAVLGLLTATTAAAAEPPGTDGSPGLDLTCAVSATAHFTPGIGLFSQSQQLTAKIQGGTSVSPATPCTSLTGVPYQGFTMTVTGTGDMSCSITALQGGARGTAQVTWDNGDTSTLTWSVTTVVMVPVVDVRVTDGALAGTTVVVGGIPSALTGNCLLNPVTGAGFAGVAEFVHLGG